MCVAIWVKLPLFWCSLKAFVVCFARKNLSFSIIFSRWFEPGNILCKLMQCKLYGPYGSKLHSFLIHSTARNKRNAVLLFRDELSTKMTCGARKSVST